MSNIDYTKDFSYPKHDDKDFQDKIYKKREFYYHKVPHRNKLENYEDIQEYRNNQCKEGEKDPREPQNILPNFINPNTPYKGVLLMHGTGVGKTMTAIRIAEQFKEQIKKYNTKVYVLVPGPNTRENIKKELIMSTGESYLKNKELLTQMSKADVEKEKRAAIYSALQYYKILSYKSFYKKVLGEKIVEKKITDDNKIKSTYKKNLEGEIEREIVIDRITNLNNSILIIDEAHNISGNEYGEALKKIIKESENLRIILLTATPMVNLADEIVDLLNFLRPLNDQIVRDKIFYGDKNYNMKIKEGGLQYLKDMARGYISYYRGSIPYTFADRNDVGIIPSGMLFTPVVKCYMDNFQYKYYKDIKLNLEDSLDRRSIAAANFIFPGLDKEDNSLKGYYSTEGLITILSQLNNNGDKLRELINKTLFNNKLTDINNFILDNGNKNITGNILKLPYIKIFSIKFFTLITHLNSLINDKVCTAFIYSNLVKASGIELLAEALIQNGYLEYQENYQNYDINDNTLDYKTGLTYIEYKKKNLNMSLFKPATFILITGSATESGEDLSEHKQKIIQDVFNDIDNVEGKHIKFILGSRVMNEGVTLNNCKEVHIVDAFYNIPKMEQVIGRAIRICVHMKVINDNYKFPLVNVYRYVVSLNNNDLSSDEILYQKAEFKYITIKEVEYGLKQVALDCPLLLNGNMFPEEIEKYKNCVPPTLENVKSGKIICPALCDFRNCDFKCDTKLPLDDKNMTYKYLDKNEIDYNTFNDNLAQFEIAMIKNKIKDLFKFKHVYVYGEMLEEIKKSLLKHQSELFENYFLDQALFEMMPLSDSDFNNFKDTIYDKYNRSGYIINRGKYYIFQPLQENEDVPMYYRLTMNYVKGTHVSLDNYINKNFPNMTFKDDTIDNVKVQNEYNFEDTIDYYENRDENFIIGIIDINTNKLAYNEPDLFKIRYPKTKNEKKRGTGIQTFKGAVCATAKDKNYLIKIIKKIPDITKTEIDRINKLTRNEICDELKNKLLYLEKYSTTKDKNKMTYVMIPSNHPIYPFPYNLEDRLKLLIKKISNIKSDIEILVKKQKDDNGNIIYELTFPNNKTLNEDIQNLGFNLNNNFWVHILK
jgi:DNA polymerase III delta prime subunit